MACHGSQLVAKAGKIKSVSDPAVWGADEMARRLPQICGGKSDKLGVKQIVI